MEQSKVIDTLQMYHLLSVKVFGDFGTRLKCCVESSSDGDSDDGSSSSSESDEEDSGADDGDESD